MLYKILPLLSLVSFLYSTSVTVKNDTRIQLSAEIYDANNTQIEKIDLLPGVTKKWQEDVSGYFGTHSSKTPLTVRFFCPHGDEYSVWHYVSSGSHVSASHGEGARTCNHKKN